MTGGQIYFNVYKSNRKNSKAKFISSYIMGTNDATKAKLKILEMAEAIIAAKNNFGTQDLIVDGWIHFVATDTQYLNANKEYFVSPSNIELKTAKVQLYSTEELIRWIYNLYMTINQENTLHLHELFNYENTKWIIKNAHIIGK